MENHLQVLCVCGSRREASFNARLADAACALLKGRVEVQRFDSERLASLPLMDQDLEAASGVPDEAVAFKQAMADADAVLWVCPEYNGSITPLLKNAIDWASRPHDTLPAPACFGDKPMALLAASPGGLGGLRGLRHVREILGNLSALVVPQQLAVPQAHKAFDETGQLANEGQSAALGATLDALLRLAGAMSRGRA